MKTVGKHVPEAWILAENEEYAQSMFESISAALTC